MTAIQLHYSHHLHRSTTQPRSRPPPPSPPPRRSHHVIISSAKSQPHCHHHNLSSRTLRAAVIGGGPAGSSAAEALAAGGIETFLIERNPSGSKPCGGAIPLCMLDEFSIPLSLVDRKVTRVNIISPSNLTVDFSKTLGSREFIAMLRREVLDSYLRSRAQSHGAQLISGLFTDLEIPTSSSAPYVVHYNIDGSKRSLHADVVIGADGAHSKVAKAISAGNYDYALAIQERIKLPDEKMRQYENLAEMYVGSDISPDFYGWVFPKCDHVAVGTGTARARGKIRRVYNSGIRERVRERISGGRVIKVEATRFRLTRDRDESGAESH
ncbi:hypothetical protein Syun_023747 [Stephania yunnanensis]|uniref:Geranylgeranyl diphosphate reductase, chloroplastic n=1 Tax=Stephania yunnanensis TaxID=152371 RepID=A0AAP0F9K4_9MAGN